MRLFLFITLIIGYSTIARSQNLKTLEDSIMYTSIYDYKEMREKADEIYRLDPLNERATYYLATSFKYAELPDSVTALFNSLKKNHPNNPKTYLLSAKYNQPDLSLNDSSCITDLIKVIELDTGNFESYYLLGSTYYTLFHDTQTIYYAHQSIVYLEQAIQIKPSSINYLKYPVIQAASFLKDSIPFNQYQHASYNIETDSLNIPIEDAWYFPFSSFLEVNEGWEFDYAVDVMYKVNYALFVMDWYSSNLFTMKEPLLYNNNKTSYRLTWLRSFHNPIAIRIKKTDTSYSIFWKKVDRNPHTYKPNKLITDNSRTITKTEWDRFINLMAAANFWEMPMRLPPSGTDGSQWIIEGNDKGNYHFVDRWTPKNTTFQKCGEYLIKLTDLHIPKNDFY